MKISAGFTFRALVRRRAAPGRRRGQNSTWSTMSRRIVVEPESYLQRAPPSCVRRSTSRRPRATGARPGPWEQSTTRRKAPTCSRPRNPHFFRFAVLRQLAPSSNSAEAHAPSAPHVGRRKEPAPTVISYRDNYPCGVIPVTYHCQHRPRLADVARQGHVLAERVASLPVFMQPCGQAEV